MVKFIIMATADGVEQEYMASILGGYDSADTDRLVVALGYPVDKISQYNGYPYMYDTLEVESPAFNN